MRKIGLNVDGDCPLCHHDEENVDHLFKNCCLAIVWLPIEVNSPKS